MGGCFGLLLVTFVSGGPSPPNLGGCNVFPATAIWNTKINDLPVHPLSGTFISTGRISPTQRLHLDLGRNIDMTMPNYWGIPWNVADGNQAWTPISFLPSNYCDEADCAVGPSHTFTYPCQSGGNCLTNLFIPLPATPQVEAGIVATSDGKDHHLLVIDSASCNLWEVYNTFKPAGGWATDGAICRWDMKTGDLRADGSTSSDAAGLPVLPFLLKYNEALNKPITHGFRFTLIGSLISGPSSVYEWPARHNTGSGAGSNSPKMGQVFRLKANFAIPPGWDPVSKAIAVALQEYGMYLADIGSNAYISGEPNANWSDTIIGEIQSITMGDFEAVDMSPVKQAVGFNISSALRPAAAFFSPTAAPPPSSPSPPSPPSPGGAAPSTGSGSSGATTLAFSFSTIFLMLFL